MQNQVVPFEFESHEVRIVTIGGEPWFVLADLCAVLDLSNPSMVAQRIDASALSQAEVSSAGQRRTVMVVSEPGMWEVVIRSDKPQAVSFRRWITGEVIPTIRKTGAFGAPVALTNDEIVAHALQITVAKVASLESKVEELKPSAEAWDELAAADGDFSVADAAKMLCRAGIETGRDRLFQSLHAMRWVYRSGGRFQALQRAVDDGYLLQKPQSHLHPETGKRVLDPPQIRVTVRGLERLRVRLGSMEAIVAAQ